MYKFRIQNIGLESINKQPITIVFDENAIIKKLFILTKPEIGFGEIAFHIDNNRIDLKIDLMNPKDSINLELITINNLIDGYKIFGKNDNVILSIFDYKNEKEKLIALLEEVSGKINQPFSLIPYLLKIIKIYPKLYKITRIDRINKEK